MNDLPRLRDTGTAADRALLAQAEIPTIAEPSRRQIRAALEQRLSPRGRRRAAWRLLLALAGPLLAGSALAFGVVHMQARRARPQPAPVSAVPGHFHFNVGPPPAASAPSAPVAAAAPIATPSATVRRRTTLRSGPGASHAQPFGLPALRGPQDLLLPPAGADGTGDDRNVAPAPSPRLVVTRPGRKIALVLAGDRIVGNVGGNTVALTVTPAHILGKLGDHRITLVLHGREAKGSIDDVPLRFELIDTPQGQALRAGSYPRGPMPVRSTRITTTASSLTWSPGCDVPLTALRDGVYQGRCARGSQVQVEIPPSWRQLPLLPRLILLSLFLTERDPNLAPLFDAATVK